MKLAITATILSTTILIAAPAQAVPSQLGFTARISDDEGLLEGPVSLTFRLFDSASGGAMVWEETHASVSAEEGLVFASLGSTAGNALDGSVFDGSDLFLEVVVEGETLAPRSAILGVPYATRAASAEVTEKLGTLSEADVARASHTHNASEIAGAFGDAQIAAYADLAAEGYLDGSAAGDLVTRAQGDSRFLNTGEIHNHSAAQISAGTLDPARYDSYNDLTLAGRLDGSLSSDLITRSFADGRFVNAGEAISASQLTAGTVNVARYDSYSELTNAGRLNNSDGADIVTRGQADARYLRSGDFGRIYGCGTYVSANFCPAGNTETGPNCNDVPAGSFCEWDGECFSNGVSNCGTSEWYFKRSE